MSELLESTKHIQKGRNRRKREPHGRGEGKDRNECAKPPSRKKKKNIISKCGARMKKNQTTVSNKAVSGKYANFITERVFSFALLIFRNVITTISFSWRGFFFCSSCSPLRYRCRWYDEFYVRVDRRKKNY